MYSKYHAKKPFRSLTCVTFSIMCSIMCSIVCSIMCFASLPPCGGRSGALCKLVPDCLRSEKNGRNAKEVENEDDIFWLFCVSLDLDMLSGCFRTM